jgi:hypothetical protein
LARFSASAEVWVVPSGDIREGSFRFPSSNDASSGWFEATLNAASVLETDALQRASVFDQVAASSSGFAQLAAF